MASSVREQLKETAALPPFSVRVLMARSVFFVIVIELPRGAGGGGALS